MSGSIRQNNLFAAEDYQKIFKAYQFIDYTAYDFDTLKQALVDYIQTYYPEDFNDYIESSEFIAIIELIAYLGTSLAFRTDLNSRENFIDTAERRESVIRLAQMVNYVPRRNIPASGLFKIASVQTDQPLTDANGININDLAVFWNDPNNPDWFDQFVQICNAAFSSINPFGRPTKSGTIGNIPTDLYELNNVLRQSVTYPVVVSINGQQYPVDICNPNFITNQTIYERDPDPLNPFNFIYRNDSLGVGSPNTGFFLYFKQGNLINIDTNFEFPVPNRVFPVAIENINQDDVYVQETDESGTVINKWVKVPALAGENIIYNSIQLGERNIFSVISGANDTISIRFADGNFGNVPTGLFRTWVRVSANQNLVIRPDQAQGMQITIPYIGKNQQQYNLTITFNLEQTIGNAAPSETNEQIKLRAPEVFSTQSRMVNGSDYNVLPLVYGNQIAKIQAINRTYSGQSRYLDLNDPTGFHRDLIIFGDDGALYRDNQNILVEVKKDETNFSSIDTILINTIQELLRDSKVSTFFYDEYLPQFESTIRVNKSPANPAGFSILNLNKPTPNTKLYWRTSPFKTKNDTGYFTATTAGTTAVPLTNTFTTDNEETGTYQPFGFITSGSVLEFDTQSGLKSVSVNSVTQAGEPLILNPVNPYDNLGPVELGLEVFNTNQAVKVYPAFRNDLTPTEIAEISAQIAVGVDFWIYFDILENTWKTSTIIPSGVSFNELVDSPFKYPDPITTPTGEEIYSDWINSPYSGLVYINIENSNTYNITARGRVYVFESYKDVRFYWEPNKIVIDNSTGQALQDTVEIMPFVNTNSTIDNNLPEVVIDPTTAYLRKPVNFNISGVYIQKDGYQDESKIEVSLVDNDLDNIPDDPGGFSRIVAQEDRIVFEYYNNEVTGYQSTRPWIAKWGTSLAGYTGNLYAYFPPDPTDPTKLFGSPFICDVANLTAAQQTNPYAITSNVLYTDDFDLMFIYNESQLTSIANDITSFFNGNNPDTENVENKTDIINYNFINKSFLISTSTPGYGIYYTFEFKEESNLNDYPKGYSVIPVLDKYHFDKNGKTFTQNTNAEQPIGMYFKWSHYSPIDQRIDPAPTNIIDMIAITNSYYTAVTNWKNNNGSLSTFPAAPTTEELRIQFQELDRYKMMSDAMVWNSGQFKILFGTQAEQELQATFKVVKSPASSISDNEIKTRVVQAIDTYFDIRNWDFGEKFFYTELAAYIHQRLSSVISSIVIVPNNATSQFGNLFEIVAGPTQLFMSTATVNNVVIVANLTDQNLRV